MERWILFYVASRQQQQLYYLEKLDIICPVFGIKALALNLFPAT